MPLESFRTVAEQLTALRRFRAEAIDVLFDVLTILGARALGEAGAGNVVQSLMTAIDFAIADVLTRRDPRRAGGGLLNAQETILPAMQTVLTSADAGALPVARCPTCGHPGPRVYLIEHAPPPKDRA